MTVEEAINDGHEVSSRAGHRVVIHDFNFPTSSGTHMMGMTYHKESGHVIRIGVFGKKAGTAYTLDGKIEGAEHDIVIPPIDREGWFIRLDVIGEDHPRVYGLFDRKDAEDELVKQLDCWDGSRGTICKMAWTERHDGSDT